MSDATKAPDKAALGETLRLTLRGYGIWWKNHPRILISTAAFSIAKALTPYVGIYLSAQIIGELAQGRDPALLTRLVILTLLCETLLALVNAGLSRWKNSMHGGLWYKHNQIYTKKMLSLDFPAIDDPHTHDLRSQVYQNANWNVWGLQKLLYLFETAVNALMTIGGAVVLTVSLFARQIPAGNPFALLNHPVFIALIIAVMLTVTFVSPILANRADAYWTRYADSAKLGNRIFRFFGFMSYQRERALDIRIYRQDAYCKQMLSKNNLFSTHSKIGKAAQGPMGILGGLSAAISQVFTGIVYVFVCLKAWGGAFGIGAVTQYIASITALSSGLSALVSVMGTLRNNAVFLRTTFEFLDIPNDMYQGSLTIEKRSDCKYELEFQNVSFKYPSANTYALRNISLKFSVGERLAVVGMNGSGKTTFIKLLCRLYDPTEGTILLNGIDIRKYDYREYMSIFSVVFQDFKLLSFELGQNIAARLSYDTAKVQACLDRVGLNPTLEKMPKGLHTCLYKDFDETGVDISGGEAQKIALARALYKNAAFLILDEPTAALDPLAEFEIYSRMSDIVGEKTAVFISHRLSSCRFCNDIAVFHEGALIQRGSHDRLVSDVTGQYYVLWNAQAQYYTD